VVLCEYGGRFSVKDHASLLMSLGVLLLKLTVITKEHRAANRQDPVGYVHVRPSQSWFAGLHGAPRWSSHRCSRLVRC
jgi:hypothetical protein